MPGTVTARGSLIPAGAPNGGAGAVSANDSAPFVPREIWAKWGRVEGRGQLLRSHLSFWAQVDVPGSRRRAG